MSGNCMTSHLPLIAVSLSRSLPESTAVDGHRRCGHRLYKSALMCRSSFFMRKKTALQNLW